MPTYDYECDGCGHTFELFQSISEPVKRKCPECKRQKLRRLIGTGAAVVFKGSGFYQTDYRSDSYKKAADAEKKSSSSSSDSGSKSGDASSKSGDSSGSSSGSSSSSSSGTASGSKKSGKKKGPA